MNVRRALFLAGSIVACGCGGGRSATLTSPVGSGTHAALVTIGPLQLVPDRDPANVLDVDVDGRIRDARGRIVGTFDGRTLRVAGTCKGVIVEGDGGVWSSREHDPNAQHLAFDARGDLLSPTGDRIVVGDDGLVSISNGGAPLQVIPMHVRGVTRETHRMAVLLTLFAFVLYDPDAKPSASSAPTTTCL